jgi:hypothetical protein
MGNGVVAGSGQQTICATKLQQAKNKIEDDNSWTPYKTEVGQILDQMADDGILYITGYPKFFASDFKDGDICDKSNMFQNPLFSPVALLKSKKTTRQLMNDLVDSVNQKIQDLVIKG